MQVELLRDPVDLCAADGAVVAQGQEHGVGHAEGDLAITGRPPVLAAFSGSERREDGTGGTGLVTCFGVAAGRTGSA